MGNFFDVLFGPSGVERTINGIVWGIPAMILIVGTGIFLSIRCGFLQFGKFGHIMKNTAGKMFSKDKSQKGAVSPFKAMCTALAASIGTGNIAGVSGAIALGGPGAVFWMWVSALFGMCTKYAEVTLAVHFRERNGKGEWVGGPMYYIKNGMGKAWKWLAALFAIFGALASFGIGNLTQINTIAGTINSAISSFTETSAETQTTIAIIIGVIASIIAFIVIVGGIKRLGDFCSTIVPFMAFLYVIAALILIFANITSVPAVFATIFKGAFNPAAIAGGLAGVGIKGAITKGVGRGVFSNEAGLGSAPIAHAAGDVDHPAKQGIFGVFEVFMDTIVVCTMTALVVLLGVGVQNVEYGTDLGSALTINGFSTLFGDKFSGVLVAVCLTLFAFSTILSWSLYGGRCVEYLFGHKGKKIYEYIFCIAIIGGAFIKLEIAWNISDTLNGLMALPNLIAVLALSPTVVRLTKEYLASIKSKKKGKASGGDSDTKAAEPVPADVQE